jgi:hypothetical protein
LEGEAPEFLRAQQILQRDASPSTVDQLEEVAGGFRVDRLTEIREQRLAGATDGLSKEYFRFPAAAVDSGSLQLLGSAL